MRRVPADAPPDGVIVMDVEPDDRRIPSMRARGTRTVLIGPPADPHGLAYVDHDFTPVGALGAEQHAPAFTFVSGPTRELGRVAADHVIGRPAAALRGEPPTDERALHTLMLTTRQSSPRLSIPEEPS
ncbi:hypothetical protein ACFYWX_34085 [Streptomyces sp. NPDC002888]|uniref:hypothetical protein n=1 Tax=Streptomyces sp. NPDC002888 TaxID=3364668 RepID=UPI00368557E5